MDKRQFLEQTIDSVRNLDISNVISRYIDLPKRMSGSELGLCPFHNDTKLGSFVVTPRKGIFKCFACGEGGDASKFVSLYKGINYIEATFEIALQERIIDYEDYEEYFAKRRYTKQEIENIEKIYIEKDKERFKTNIADVDTLDKVFNIFLDTLKLKPEHKEYLNNERKLSDEIIEKRKYKSCQSATDIFMEKFEEALNEAKIPIKILERMPGFFQKQIKGEWKWTFAYNKGIFIPIRNAEGKIVGLQVRRDKKDEYRGRYFWFSSSFALYNEKFKYGVSSSSPLDVLYPDKQPNRVLFITEGRFKSEAVIEKIDSTCISVQGVGNWRNINKEIQKIEKILFKKYPRFEGFTNVYIAFDSDMSYKYQVYEQLKSMSDFIEENINLKEVTRKDKNSSGIYYLHWKSEYKGIDDLLLNSCCNNPEECGKLFTFHRKKYWDSEYEKKIKQLMKEKGVTHPKDLSQNDLTKIYIEKEVKR